MSTLTVVLMQDDLLDADDLEVLGRVVDAVLPNVDRPLARVDAAIGWRKNIPQKINVVHS